MNRDKDIARNERVRREEILSERRLNILNHLFAFSVSTMEQIRRDVLKNCSTSFAYYEMGRLEKCGYVDRMAFFRNGRAKGAYALTPKGFGYCFFEEDGPPCKKYRPGSLLHDLELVDIAHRLKKSSAVQKYYTENELFAKRASLLEKDEKEIFDLAPDALIELKRDGKSYFFAVEYEASLKYKDRAEDKINRYYDCPELYGCLLICKTKQLVDRMKAVERKENPQSKEKIYYGILEEVKENKGEMTFFGMNGAKLCIL